MNLRTSLLTVSVYLSPRITDRRACHATSYPGLPCKNLPTPAPPMLHPMYPYRLLIFFSGRLARGGNRGCRQWRCEQAPVEESWD